METLNNLAFGLGVALSWQNLLYCFIGCFLGTLVGVLPGIGPVATVAMLLPFTFGLEPAPALIMLAGIYTVRSTAARPRRSWSIFRARPHPS